VGSSTDTNLGHNQLKKKIKKKSMVEMVLSNRIFSESSWPLIVFNTVFGISATRATQDRRQN
jgi:hypothetical protein